MKQFHSILVAVGAFITASLLAATSAIASINFLGVAAGDATTDDVIVWTRAKDESNPQPTDINVQISTNPGFAAGATTTFLAGTAGSPTDYTVKADVTGLQPGTIYYYRFQTTDAAVTSNVGKFKTAPGPKAHMPCHFAFSGDCDGLIRPYALASQVASKNLDFFMFDGDTEYETSASIGSPAAHSDRMRSARRYRPDLISNHSFSLAKKLADSIANAESTAGIEPIGLALAIPALTMSRGWAIRRQTHCASQLISTAPTHSTTMCLM